MKIVGLQRVTTKPYKGDAMKKLLVAMVALLAVGNAFAGFFGCGSCRTGRTSCNTEYKTAECEPKPVCYKMVRKEVCPRKVCETSCHYVCPNDSVREDGCDNGE